METITNAANAAASYLGYDAATDKKETGETLSELVHDKDGTSTTGTSGTTGTTTGGLSSLNPYSSTSQSGTEPVSGKLGSGTAGQPYDAGNVEDGSAGYGRSSGGLTGGSGGGLLSGLTGGNNSQTTSSGYAGGLAGNNSNYNQNTSSGLTGSSYNQGTSSGLLGGLTGSNNYDNNNRQNTSSGLTGGSTGGLLGGLMGSNTRYQDTTNSGYGNNTNSGYGNTTGYSDTTDRGLGAEAAQQGNHYTSTATAGKLGDKFGLNAAHRVDDGSSSHTHGLGHTHGSTHNHGLDRDHSHDRDNSSRHGLGGAGDVGQAGYHATGLGSDRSAVTYNDRYLFNSSNAPGGGGRHSRLIDDFTDANIHHEGTGRKITGDVGSDASSGVATHAGHGLGSTGADSNRHSNTGSDLTSGRNYERSRRPGYERMGSGLSYGNASHGLNSGRPKESIGSRLEHKVEEYAPAAGVAGAGYGATHSGREPLSGQRGTGVGGEPYDMGNRFDGTSSRDSPYGYDSGVSQATSGVSGLNLNQRSTDNTYSGYNDGRQSEGLAGAGLAAAGLGAAGHNNSTRDSNYATPTGPGLTSTGERGNGDGRDFGATASRNANDSTFGRGGLEERIAGAPHADNHDGCEDLHHNIHATGVQAHADGVNKPTFLNYQHDQFGIPIAKGQ